MRRFQYLTAVALTFGCSAGAFAQGGGGGGGGFGGGAGGGGTGLSGGGTGLSGGGTGLSGGGTGLSGGGMGLSGGGTGLSGGGTGLSGGGTGLSGGGMGVSGGGGGGGAGGSGGFQVSQTNFLSKTFANPMSYGRPGSSNTSMGKASAQATGSGFGQPSFGAVTAAKTPTTTGRAGSATINRGTTGTGSTAQASYATTMRFPTAPVVMSAVRLDLQAVVNRSSALRVPGRVRVESDGDAIILRGKVADEDEKRLVEGMIRLEPGVHEVRNELEIGP